MLFSDQMLLFRYNFSWLLRILFSNTLMNLFRLGEVINHQWIKSSSVQVKGLVSIYYHQNLCSLIIKEMLNNKLLTYLNQNSRIQWKCNKAFQQPALNQYWEMIENANIFTCLKTNFKHIWFKIQEYSENAIKHSNHLHWINIEKW